MECHVVLFSHRGDGALAATGVDKECQEATHDTETQGHGQGRAVKEKGKGIVTISFGMVALALPLKEHAYKPLVGHAVEETECVGAAVRTKDAKVCKVLRNKRYGDAAFSCRHRGSRGERVYRQRVGLGIAHSKLLGGKGRNCAGRIAVKGMQAVKLQHLCKERGGSKTRDELDGRGWIAAVGT